MSYYIITEKYMEPVKTIRDHSGKKNPHYNHPHSDSAKTAISTTQKCRYELLRKAVEKASNQITEERIMEIVRQTCSEYLAKNVKPLEKNKNINISL